SLFPCRRCRHGAIRAVFESIVARILGKSKALASPAEAEQASASFFRIGPEGPIRRQLPAPTTEVIEFRFCAQAASVEPSATGRSFPYEMVLMRVGATPSETR